jgi:hypothetical protein
MADVEPTNASKDKTPTCTPSLPALLTPPGPPPPRTPPPATPPWPSPPPASLPPGSPPPPLAPLGPSSTQPPKKKHKAPNPTKRSERLKKKSDAIVRSEEESDTPTPRPPLPAAAKFLSNMLFHQN